MLNWHYQPDGPILSEFLDDDSFVTGIKGPIGSGKSTACVMKILKKSSEQKPNPQGRRRSRWAIVRNTYPELKTTTIKTWHQWVPPHLGRWQQEGPPTHFIRHGDIDMEVMFIALDSPRDVSKLLSLELTGAWINEAREIPKAVLDGLTGRVTRFPPKNDGGSAWFGIFMDTNPPDDDHWWYKLAERTDQVMMEEMETLRLELVKESVLKPEQALFNFYNQPGGRTSGAENLSNLQKGYYLLASAGKGPDWVNVYVDGNYGFVRDGKPVYPEYNDQIHCKEVEFNKDRTLWIGVDFGLTPAALFAQNDINGGIRWIDELVTEDMGASRFGELLNSKIKRDYPNATDVRGYGDPSGDARAQTDETTAFQILNAKIDGFSFYPASTNDFALRREAVAVPMQRLIFGGKPGFIISPKCIMARKGLAGGYMYKRLMVIGHEKYQDKPDKNKYSHVCEAGQYVNLGMGEGSAIIKSKRIANRPRQAETEYNIFGL